MLFARKLRNNRKAGLLAYPAFLMPSHPSRQLTGSEQWQRFKKHDMGLQLRGQLPNYTGFPFNSIFKRKARPYKRRPKLMTISPFGKNSFQHGFNNRYKHQTIGQLIKCPECFSPQNHRTEI